MNDSLAQDHATRTTQSKTNLVVLEAGVGEIVARVHCALVHNNSGQIVHVLGHVDGEIVLLDGVWQHVHGQREVDVAVHLFGGVGGVFVALSKC
jgi:hypothetical protein